MSLSAREIDALHGIMRALVSRVGNGAKAPSEELVSVHRKLLHAKAVIEQRKGERAPTRWPLNGTGATT